MNTNQSSYQTTEKEPSKWNLWVIAFALLAGLVLSILSWLEVCVEHCSANEEWRLFGFPFAIIGILFFTSLNILYYFAYRSEFLLKLVGFVIATALGSEIVFIGVQKYEIGHWCPVCLSIAFSVALAAVLLFLTNLKRDQINQPTQRGKMIVALKHTFTSFGFILAGFLVSFVGVSKPDLAQAAINDMKDKIAFGNKHSPIEVYFVTDWFCPSCRKIEPLIETVYPKIQNKVAFYFIDYPIHKNSLNFTPYNLAFIINDKPHYFKARNALTALSRENESPTDEDIIEISQANGLHFKELSFIDVKTGMDLFNKTVEKYQLKATPVLIVTDPKTNRAVKMEGTDEITEAKILKAIESLTPKKAEA